MHQWNNNEELFGKPCKDMMIKGARFKGSTEARLEHCVSVWGTIECPHCKGKIALQIEKNVQKGES